MEKTVTYNSTIKRSFVNFTYLLKFFPRIPKYKNNAPANSKIATFREMHSNNLFKASKTHPNLQQTQTLRKENSD